jgi:hypothetical protein
MNRSERIPRVVAVEALDGFRLRLEFDDGLVREVDLSAELIEPVGPMFEPLRDPEFFSQVRVDEELGTIVWPNGADMDSVVLHGDHQPLAHDRTHAAP